MRSFQLWHYAGSSVASGTREGPETNEKAEFQHWPSTLRSQCANIMEWILEPVINFHSRDRGGKQSVSTGGQRRSRLGSVAVIVVVAGLLGFVVIIAARPITGHSLVLWTFASSEMRSIADLGQAVLNSRSVSSHSIDDFTNVVFPPNSRGHNLIEQGGVREKLSEANYGLWDHGHNCTGLRRPDGSYTGYGYGIPGDNTNPDDLAKVFSERP